MLQARLRSGRLRPGLPEALRSGLRPGRLRPGLREGLQEQVQEQGQVRQGSLLQAPLLDRLHDRLRVAVAGREHWRLSRLALETRRAMGLVGTVPGR